MSDDGKKKPAAAKKKPKKKKKKAPKGLAAFTEGKTVPWWVTAARVVMILAFAACIPVILGVHRGRQMFWAAAIASLPLFWVVGGYHLWRRICPLAVLSQIARYLGQAGQPANVGRAGQELHAPPARV